LFPENARVWLAPACRGGDRVRPETIKKRIRDIRQLPDQAGHTIQPGPHRLASLNDLSSLAAAEGILARQRSRQLVNDLQALKYMVLDPDLLQRPISGEIIFEFPEPDAERLRANREAGNRRPAG
jgi:hypothetical protein